ncbi:hypothetical protein F3Y22_tig00116958pilonHSYRG00123 [Hibiscus syriacus]|uniref:Uncharacterized protein n=1 Tax=Hibiscus syriacus TaxID=106335 RepID=A0A6A2XP23_HIBSY|nr:hypothetical protein F3Y22_tig00116958pilonHSYRG00123 [Hibiscus syriacus]
MPVCPMINASLVLCRNGAWTWSVISWLREGNWRDAKILIQMEALLETLKERNNAAEEKARTLKVQYENVMKEKVLPQIKEAEAEYVELEKNRKNRVQYENVMKEKVLPQIKEAEAEYVELEKNRELQKGFFLRVKLTLRRLGSTKIRDLCMKAIDIQRTD